MNPAIPPARPARRRIALPLLLAAACSPFGALVTDLPADLDGDGYVAAADGGPDCDDADPAIHPDAVERCDGTDNDCDGNVDGEDAVDALTWYLDADGDGFGDPASPAVACEPPARHVPDGTDCDDGEPMAFPGGVEVCGDGIDEDCDGWEPPCHPSGTTWLDDAARTALLGEAAGDHAGHALAAPGDVDGDGRPDLLVGAPYRDAGAEDAGAAYLVAGPPPPGEVSLGDATAQWQGEDSFDYAGWTVAGAGDVDADGNPDVLVGAYAADAGGDYAGAVYLLRGPAAPGARPLGEADLRLQGEASYDFAGYRLAGVGDVDGDGYDDFLVASPAHDDPRADGGAVYLVTGPPPKGAATLADADLQFYPEEDGAYLGDGLAGAGDVDGDGVRDLLVGAYGDRTLGAYTGAVYVFLGPPPRGLVDVASADARLYGEAAYDYAGWAVAGAGDVDGDGHDDILVGAYGNDAGGSEAGAAYLVLGPPPAGTNKLTVADTVLHGEGAAASAGRAVSTAGDVNADGLADVLVGANGDSTVATYAGAAYLLLGPLPGGVHDLGEAEARLVGSAADEQVGGALAAAGDLDGDGFDDLLVGAVGAAAQGDGTGAAYLVLGGL